MYKMLTNTNGNSMKINKNLTKSRQIKKKQTKIKDNLPKSKKIKGKSKVFKLPTTIFPISDEIFSQTKILTGVFISVLAQKSNFKGIGTIAIENDQF